MGAGGYLCSPGLYLHCVALTQAVDDASAQPLVELKRENVAAEGVYRVQNLSLMKQLDVPTSSVPDQNRNDIMHPEDLSIPKTA